MFRFACYLIWVWLFLSINWLLFANDEPGDPPHVLVLNSYHPGYWWTDAVIQGIGEEIEEKQLHAKVSIEFMDTKRYHPDKVEGTLKELYSSKYPIGTVDLVIVCDNNALTFYRDNQELLFPNVDAVFCGINNFTPSLIEGIENITGVVEELYFQETLNLVARLYDGITDIAVVSDMTNTDITLRGYMKPLIVKNGYRYKFHEFIGYTPEEIREAMKTLPDTSIVFFSNYHLDSNGVYYSLKEGIELLKSSCDFPIYSFWECKIKEGILGGHVESGRLQGRRAVELASRMLVRTAEEVVPIDYIGPNNIAFNWNELEKSPFTLRDLPPETVIYHAPDPLLEKYRNWIIGLVVFLAVQATLIAMLLVNIRMRHQAEKAVKRSKRLYKTLVDNIDYAITLHDSDYQVVLSNSRARHIWGRQFCEKSKRFCYELLDQPDQLCDECPLRLALEKGDNLDVEATAITADGNKIPVQVKTFPLRNEAGEFRGFIEVVEDITDRKKAEQRIVQAMNKAEAANQTKDEFLSVVSHELRTPLNPILGYVSMMIDEPDSIPFRGYLAEILSSCQRLEHLIDGMLDFSVFQKSAYDIRIREFSPAPLIDDLKIRLTDYVDVSRLEVVNGIESKADSIARGVYFYQDDVAIAKVLKNLMLNALKFSEDEKVEVLFGQKQDEQGNKHLRFEIRDSGIGIPKERVDSLFQPFSQADGSSHRLYEGVGLGLAISKKIVDVLDGEIGYEPNKEQGSVFWFETPVR